MNSAPWKTSLVVLPALALATAAFGAEPAKDKAKDKEPAEPTFVVTPLLRFAEVSGDKEKFREDWWFRDGFTGGIEEFSMREKVGPKKDANFIIEGRGIFDEEDYRLRLELSKPDVGFIRAGFTQYHKYFDGTGGYYPLFSTPAFELNKDLYLDVGNWFVEAGITKPNLPKVTVGFEHQFKEGDKSMIEWGSVTQTLTSPPLPAGTQPLGIVEKKIYPAFKDIDESVDIFKVDIDHTIGKVHFVDQFRYEDYSNDTFRMDDAQRNLTTGAMKDVTVREDFNHDQFSNAYYMESHVHEKVYLSAGYLFSNLNGGGDVELNTSPFGGLFDKAWYTQMVSLDQDSHVLNGNIMVGPFAGLTAYAGVQAEQTDTDGRADAILREIVPPGPPAVTPRAMIFTDNDKSSVQEHAGLRFTKIPYTVVYAEGRMAQQTIDLTERQLEDGALDGPGAFRRRTDTEVERSEYTVGFNTSPIRRATLSAHYKNSFRQNNYDHVIDEKTAAGVLVAQEGYSAFITGQEFQTDEVSARLTVRPINRVSASFGWQWVTTDIDTSTDPVPSVGIPRGTVNSGDYYAQIYSASLTVTPCDRLYLTGYFSLTDSRTVTFDNEANSTIPFKGDVYTVMGSAGYALDDKSDATLEYMFSRAFNYDNNGYRIGGPASMDFGLPYGVDNTRRAFFATVSRRISNNVTARLRYGYVQYDEDHTGGIDNYIAHLAMATCTIRF